MINVIRGLLKQLEHLLEDEAAKNKFLAQADADRINVALKHVRSAIKELD